MKNLYPKLLQTVKSFSAGFLFITMTGSSLAQQLNFQNPVLVSGIDLQTGATYRFTGIAVGVDALVTIDNLVNGCSLQLIDDNSTGVAGAFQPTLETGGPGLSYASFTINFVKTGTNVPVTFFKLTSSVFDIDGNANLNEFAEIDINNANAYLVSPTPHINLQQTGNTAIALNTAGIEFPGLDPNEKEVAFETAGTFIHNMKVRVGTTTANSLISSRQYGIDFTNYTYNFTLPVTLTNFQVFHKNNTATLNWTTANHYQFGHFIIQKSTDGRNYADIDTIYASSNTTATNTYEFADNTGAIATKALYYRLKMVNTDGSYSFSDTRLIRILNDDARFRITTFPNPVTNELRVQIPAEWQEKSVVYELLNAAGAVVMRVQQLKAAQIQQMNIEQLEAGSYVLRVSNGTAVSASKIIKR